MSSDLVEMHNDIRVKSDIESTYWYRTRESIFLPLKDKLCIVRKILERYLLSIVLNTK